MMIYHLTVPFKGIAAGTAVLYERSQQNEYLASGDKNQEQLRFEKALSDVKYSLSTNVRDSDVFSAHLEMLSDPMLEETVVAFIDDGISAYDAVGRASDSICSMFADIDDEYLRSRSDDIRDIFNRISMALSGNGRTSAEVLPDGCIVVAEELLPSDTLSMDLDKVAGFITASGSQTSHVGIIARNRGIPAVLGFADCLETIKAGDRIVIDSEESVLYVNPDEECYDRYIGRMSCMEESDNEPALTLSGRCISVMCNAGSVPDVRLAIGRGADGIGLFRSEFIFMKNEDQGEPSELSQFEVYRDAALLCKGKVLVIRLLDIGGDKKPSYVVFGKEDNPFLGLRGVRYLLANPDVLKRQLRAILRASAYALGVVRIMIPMVTEIREIEAVKTAVCHVMQDLDNEGVGYDENIKIGIMIETPAAVLLAEELAEKSDFFSIGTNDLTQYIMAADRSLQTVGALCDYSNPAVKKAVSAVCRGAEKAGIHVGMCGEMASDNRQTAFLLEAGIDSLSVGCSVLKSIKSNIRNLK